MANFFKNDRAVVTTSAADVYTCPANRVAIVLNCQVANVSAGTEELDIWWTDASAGAAVTRLGKNIQIPNKASFSAVVGKLVLESGDKIRAQAIAGSSPFEATVSVLEIE
jgi:hypothetical protein